MVKKLVSLLLATVFLGVVFMHLINFFLPMKYQDEIKSASIKYGVDEKLIYAVIKTESNFRENATSVKDAKGLMQLKDDTAKWCASKMNLENFSPDNIYDPETNINLGVWYLSYLISETGSEDLAIIAYNAGINRVKQWKDSGIVSETIQENNQIPYPETKNYLKKVKYFKILYGYRLKY